ncbi:cytochrome c-type biogenesis protein [Spectribacter hydrogenoxidans]|uniref:Cytochrome c-type biogenesis protein n=1 Tax=Spectribacter hydrogenoxidans TaxID=3075608 RepID=A0ABU3C2R9_9GAMM|nr:cytochrome c-type biogenesis protein [Salinisphaera sp. W335]MDT0635644.1 cytochrome c-type biogenesis protein [Salinisphaera sp. W335]
MKVVVSVLFLIFSSIAAAAPPALDEAQTHRYHQLIDQVRCLVCQNRTIAESDAPLAADLRDIIGRQIAAGRSNEEIKNYLVQRYGEWVLYKPRFSAATWILWLGPAALLLAALVSAILLWRRTGRRAEPPAPDEDSLARILDDERRS